MFYAGYLTCIGMISDSDMNVVFWQEKMFFCEQSPDVTYTFIYQFFIHSVFENLTILFQHLGHTIKADIDNLHQIQLKTGALYRIEVYRLYRYFDYMIDIVSFSFIEWYFKRNIFA